MTLSQYYNFWQLRIEDRLHNWLEFRKELTTLTKQEVATRVNTLWGSAPFVKHYLTPLQYNTWPGPWDLISDNVYCDVSKGLGAFYTLALSDVEFDYLFNVYRQTHTNTEFHLIEIDNYVINYWPFELATKEDIQKDGLELDYTITKDDLKIQNYL
jgi:hypothetical protein